MRRNWLCVMIWSSIRRSYDPNGAVRNDAQGRSWQQGEHKNKIWGAQVMKKQAFAIGCLFALQACLPVPDLASRGVAAPTSLAAAQPSGDASATITSLLDRRSVISSGPYLEVMSAVLAANSGAAEADLRAAKLRAEARASNWLPTLGPQISLTSLGAVVSSLVVEQVLFDNGRKKAERDYAAADVEVAAVTLSQDTNDRVLSALSLYLTAQAADARAKVNADAMERMTHFEYVMSERVKGGVSTHVDHRIVQQKRDQMLSEMASDREASAAAMAELAAMAGGPLDGVTGLSVMSTELLAEPLSVTKARAESARVLAEATAARAGFLPGLTASGTVGGEGALNVSAPNGFGFGTGANLRALDQQKAAAEARIAQVQEDANRRLAALEGQLASLQRQDAQAQSLAAQAAANYEVYAQQQQAGQRAVPEVVSVFETKVRTEREAAGLRFDAAKVALKIAALRGVLVDGDAI